MKKVLIYILFTFLFSSCGTGIESTPKITEKDVKKAMAQAENLSPGSFLKIGRDSVPVWKKGKRFFVTDDQVKLIFSYSPDYDADTLHLAGKYLDYDGYSTGSLLDNRKELNLKFSDGKHGFIYASGKTLQEFTSRYTIPFLIDEDLVKGVASQLAGKKFFIKTSIWYDPQSERMIDGRQFIEVKIDRVLPGNKVLPLKVLFTASDNGQQGFLWMSSGETALHSRDFDSMFSLHDIHQDFPGISRDVWQHIIHREVVPDMTKEECRLAKGAPRSINQLPDPTGLREYWYYDGGSYLFFQDGILKQFRR